MKWTQITDPLHHLGLSALVAALPIAFIFWALIIRKMKGHTVCLLTALAGMLIAILVYGMPVKLAVLSIADGALFGLFTICWIIMGVLFFGGLCRSMQFTAVTTLSYADIPQSRMSAASSFGSVIQQMSLGLGVAVGALALHLARAFHANGSVPTIPDFHLAFTLLAMLTLVGVVGFTRLDPNAGAEVSGHRIEIEKGAGAKT